MERPEQGISVADRISEMDNGTIPQVRTAEYFMMVMHFRSVFGILAMPLSNLEVTDFKYSIFLNEVIFYDFFIFSESLKIFTI